MVFHFVSPHHQLPSPLDEIASWILMEDVLYADSILVGACVLLTSLVFIQLRAFSRPPPVPLKRLPRRPALHILFKPEGDTTATNNNSHTNKNHSGTATTNTSATATATTTSSTSEGLIGLAKAPLSMLRRRRRKLISHPADVTKSVSNSLFGTRASSSQNQNQQHHQQQHHPLLSSPVAVSRGEQLQQQGSGSAKFDGGDDVRSLPTHVITTPCASPKTPPKLPRYPASSSSQQPKDRDDIYDDEEDDFDDDEDDEYDEVYHDVNEEDHAQHGHHNNSSSSIPPFFQHIDDLPDSFAPLLSSSHMEVLNHYMTADLIHGVHVEAGIRMPAGRHEIPLDKDLSRPQFIMNVPKGGCRLSAVAGIGSDGFSTAEDLDVSKPTTTRSRPMVKHAGLVLDPPLPLVNVAPTLIHFPTLFDDNTLVPTLRRIQILRLVMDFVVSISSFLEKLLWILESKCQIHLSKVRVTPIYKGRMPNDNNNNINNSNAAFPSPSPEWRLTLAFSGHVLLFGWIPIPFVSVTLPTFIIPQPHALLEYLMTAQPLASATLRRENIAEQRILLAVLDTLESWQVDLKVVATPPALGVDITLPGGLGIALELMHGRDPRAGRNRQAGVWTTTNNTTTTNNSVNDPSAAASAARGASAVAAAAAGAGATGAATTTTPVPQSKSAAATAAANIIKNNSSNESVISGNSMSSWSTHQDVNPHARNLLTSPSVNNLAPFDANQLVPWSLEFVAKGSISREKMTLQVVKCSASHEDITLGGLVSSKSHFATRGSLAVWKADPMEVAIQDKGTVPIRRRRTNSGGSHFAALAATDVASRSVAELLLFPDDTISFHRQLRLLQYDYAFDVYDGTGVDAITLAVGASHPMLRGGTMVTTILESIYLFGSISAQEGALLDPCERRQKRNILRHLPVVDFTFGIQNCYIPPASMSYSDDGQTRCLPEMEGGRMMVRFLGGMEATPQHFVSNNSSSINNSNNSFYNNNTNNNSIRSRGGPDWTPKIVEGIKVVADFGIASIVLNSESNVKEFPELDIFEGTKLRSLWSARINGSIHTHLRPQKLSPAITTIGPNIFNPLEAYEIDFSGSSLSAKIKESSTTLGHRRIIIPTETTFRLKVVESVVDMALEGTTQCELSWDFQGVSPILQVTAVGQSPADAMHENKEQVSLLIAPLRQGRLNFHVSPVGGISITKAATSREDKEGLYDWKFFNALVSPDQKSAERLLQVIHDKRTMDKVLQVAKLINQDLYKIVRYFVTQIWRAKEIFDQEGVSDPGHAIPGRKMARLISLLLCGSLNEVDSLHAVIQRVVAGEGLDVVKVKELLRQYLEIYDDYAPEIDRGVRWASLMLGPMAVNPPYVEADVAPLCELQHHAARFRDIPSARQLYEHLSEKSQLPLDPSFSNLVSRVAPYMSFRQIEYFLQVRASTDWQPADLRRLRYVYSVKRKVLEIAESYGGLSFLPQSFLVSVFLGEATRSSLRASRRIKRSNSSSVRSTRSSIAAPSNRGSTTISSLRRRRRRGGGGGGGSMPAPQQLSQIAESADEDLLAVRVASRTIFVDDPMSSSGGGGGIPERLFLDMATHPDHQPTATEYELGDSLLGPQDVAILLQAGLTSAMKGSTVVQLNQRMLLDLIASQPRSFAVAVLAEIGTPGGQGSPRGLTSALMALLELDQSSFNEANRLDMHALLEQWLPGVKIPKRDDYMAGGRWARQSYYEAIYSVSTSILEDAECYMALKSHIQRDRAHTESDPLPHARDEPADPDCVGSTPNDEELSSTKWSQAISNAKAKIVEADEAGSRVVAKLLQNEQGTKKSEEYSKAIEAYRVAFDACARVLALDKLAFHSSWFRDFYKRNYDALMIKSIFDNVIDDVDKVRYWLNALRRDSKRTDEHNKNRSNTPDHIFLQPEKCTEQQIVDAILDVIVYLEKEREQLRGDPLVRLLIANPPGMYHFSIVTAMGVITEGKRGLELEAALRRLEAERGVTTIRSDTGTARSFEFNAAKIEEAIEAAIQLQKPYGLLGYSQGCANALMAESTILSGSPLQQRALFGPRGGLVCRQLLFSAANGSMHGPATDKKIQCLIVTCEEFFKYQQGYFSRALASGVLEILNNIMDSAPFQKFIGGAQSMLPDGCRAFWREAQHLPHVPTSVLRGVMEDHTTPESLEMISNLLTKQSGSKLHDSQVHVYDTVGYPVYHHNRNGRLLQKCAVGEGFLQRTHHWSPLSDEVEFVQTQRDIERASFDCAKDRHVFPWVDVNVRFGIIKYATEKEVQEQVAMAAAAAAAAGATNQKNYNKHHGSGGGGGSANPNSHWNRVGLQMYHQQQQQQLSSRSSSLVDEWEPLPTKQQQK